MAYNHNLANRIRQRLADIPTADEKEMMGGLCFMLNEKMCIGVMKDDMMCRIDPEVYEQVVKMHGCRAMEMGSKVMRGFVLVSEEAIRSAKEFEFWINLCLEFNPRAKSSKKSLGA